MPRLVRTLVCGYSLGELPTPWLMTFHRFEAALERAGLDVRVKLAPLEDLPEEPFEVLVVPPELGARAAALDTGAYVIPTSSTEALMAIERLLALVEAGDELTAQPLDPGAPRVERYRGSLPL
ncbi:MAG TPA: hypothetical protein VK009_27780 [Chloroflexota bacterium]|nr:hypothetical protein [Chloroflexota bacterium]